MGVRGKSVVFHCPRCGSHNGTIYKTRRTGAEIIRYRMCDDCGKRIKTVEALGMEVVNGEYVPETFPCHFDCFRCTYSDCMRSGKEIVKFERWLEAHGMDEREYIKRVRKGEIEYDPD